jgi:UDP-N-acetylmuramate: L-alanyl-gamma-D-glutamyl-meso-diaminopimelate ligase
LAGAFAGADLVVVAGVAKLEQIPEVERLDADQLMADLRAVVGEAEYLPDVGAIVAHIAMASVEGDVVCVMSNGGFGGIHDKLLAALRA